MRSLFFHTSRQKWLRAADMLTEALLTLKDSFKANFDPSQPRDERGRWTDTGIGDETEGDATIELVALRGKRALEARCLAQYARDTFHCTMLGLRACHEQAAFRFANCLTRKPIPPLNY